jgi:hypothetical protein
MIDLSLEHTVNAQWHGIAEIAEEIRVFIKARHESAPPQPALITRIARGIDFVDTIFAEGKQMSTQLSALSATIAEMDPAVVDQYLARLAEIRKRLQNQETIVLTCREQLLDLMFELNPEDAWVWTPEALADIREAKADAAAGRGTFYESGEAFLAALESRAG